jgi:hypothetical protein
MRLKIFVTPEILERAKWCGEVGGLAAYNCAIALAVREIFPKASVTRHSIHPFDSPDFHMPLPSAATAFISDFDVSTPKQRPDMPPIDFEIDVPDSVIEMIGIEEATEIIRKSETLEIVT